ncbi:MAG TPA: MlaD family protein [Gemmatimonadota bacterium]|nr:MlaD family protein [Gemmatimonadota bacterium]
MSPRKSEPSWRDLRLGIGVAGIGILALLVVIGLGSGRGPLKPETYTLYVNLDDAGGLRVGSPVEVGGAPAGQVVDVTILPPERTAAIRIRDSLGRPVPLPPDQDIRVELVIEERFRSNITTRSRAQLASLGMGGERYVKILPGDVREEPLETGATIPVVASVDLDLVLARVGRAANEVQEIAYLGTELQGKVASGAGTAGKLVDTESALYDRVDRFEDRAQSLIGALDEGGGVVPSWRSDGRLKTNLDALRSDLSALSDSTPALDQWSDPAELREALAGLRTEVRTLSAKLASGEGTLGRLLNDEELVVQIRVLRLGLAEMMTAIGEDPMGSVNIELH